MRSKEVFLTWEIMQAACFLMRVILQKENNDTGRSW